MVTKIALDAYTMGFSNRSWEDTIHILNGYGELIGVNQLREWGVLTTRLEGDSSGRVTKLHASLGQHVKKGAPLMTVVSPDVGSFSSDLDKASADLVAAQREHRFLQGRVLPEHARQAEAALVLLAQQHDLAVQAAALEGPVEQQQQVLGVDRLGEEGGGAFLHGPHRVLDRAEGGHHDHGQLGVELLGGLDHAETVAARQPEILQAISCGAVFMGANTYIGNGPNFMVRSIAEERGVRMPSFGGYMLYSGSVLVPVFLLVTLVFFR